MKITKRALLIGVLLGVTLSGLNYLRLFYFPWENGYRVFSEQRIGYQQAKSNNITTPNLCQLPDLSDGYKEGCLAFLSK